ncbi:AGE family epimerase/isomerase [Stappia taiwanensis]|uniref:AGE family epimerase/isomerase n=2 Tax=Stappia taiwanensis TaxID=992267 RepID=A0A838XT31_9HYPH|nr:AGE family epimerase/isomerase [Stappia taiwanensis]GGE76608.1 AGE family epimerase/isomerase [Stappia taiwanensis]
MALATSRDRLLTWLREAALPVWAVAGFDPQTGRFAEKLDLATATDTGAVSRPRVPPRQIFAFLVGRDLGWSGPAGEIACKGLIGFLRDFEAPDGTIRLRTASGGDGEGSFDLYDQSFALLAYAHLAAALPELRDEMEQRAGWLAARLCEHYAHAEAGFEEDVPRRLPLRANPHMHLFEAARAWEAVSDNPAWEEMADEIAELALSRFISPVTGALREFFDGDWQPMPGAEGRVVEPGHQFEWAWLLTGWARARGRTDALAAARALYVIGRDHGICPQRQVAFFSLTNDLQPLETHARLWSQTEWLKAALIQAEEAASGPERSACLTDAQRAIAALERFLAVKTEGLWFDRISPDGKIVAEPAPASSLYHIVGAIAELDRVVQVLDQANG